MNTQTSPLYYGPNTIALQVSTRRPSELTRDDCGDYSLNSGYYGQDPEAGSWSVETGYNALGKDMGYWTRVRDNAELIDRWMAENRPARSTRLAIRFRDDQVVISSYDWDTEWAVLPAADR